MGNGGSQDHRPQFGDEREVDRIRVLGEIAEVYAAVRPEAVALSFESEEVTYAELRERVRRVAAGLLESGVNKGDRVAYLGKNSAVFFEVLLAAGAIGAVTCPIGWRLATPEVAFVLRDTGARILFIAKDFDGIVGALRQEAQSLQTVIRFGAPDADYSDWRDGRPGAPLHGDVSEHEPTLQLYTSGTTGAPKGAILSHANLLGTARLTGPDMEWNEWSADDVSLVAMPVAHIGGSRWGVMTLMHGAKAVIAREFDPLKVLEFIQQDRVSKLFLVPSAMQIIVRLPAARAVDYARLRVLLYGASPIAPGLLAECMEVFGCGFCQQYGMTETSGAVAFLPPRDHHPQSPRLRSAGRALPGVDLKVVGPDGIELPRGQIGEVVAKSSGSMLGYWGLPEATAKALSPDGWVSTGDAAFMDEDGYIYIQDRIKDMIISGGENVYPAEVEAALHDCPGLSEVAIIGVPDPKWGEAVKAIVVRKPGQALEADEVIAFARRRVAAFKAPKTVDFIDELPRNASGKVLRRALRDRFWRGQERAVG